MLTAEAIAEAIEVSKKAKPILRSSHGDALGLSQSGRPRLHADAGKKAVDKEHVAKPNVAPVQPKLIITSELVQGIVLGVVDAFRGCVVAHPERVAQMVLRIKTGSDDLIAHLTAAVNAYVIGNQRRRLERRNLIKIATKGMAALLEQAWELAGGRRKFSTRSSGPPSGYRRAPKRAPQLRDFTVCGSMYTALVFDGKLHDIVCCGDPRSEHLCCRKFAIASRRYLRDALRADEFCRELSVA